jgi:transposase
MKRTKPTVVELNMHDLEGLLQRVEAGQLNDDDREIIKTVFLSYVNLTDTLKDKNVSMRRLRKMLFGLTTEKTAAILGDAADSSAPSSLDENESPEPGDQSADSHKTPKTPRKGHGRNGADAYAGAEKISVPHDSLQPGDACPDCGRGTVYETNRPGVLVRITGHSPVRATIYQLQKLRCNLCGKVFKARVPERAGTRKYDATAGSMIALLKYGTGMPFNRFAGLQGNLGVPLPASTQWDIVETKAKQAKPAYAELIRQAARGDIVFNDDTTVRILERMGKRAEQKASADGAADPNDKWTHRTGLFTSGIVSTREGRRIALFFSGRQHAGENLGDVLMERAQALGPPIQMCDALSRNLPAELETIVAHCLAHGRRQFVDVAEHFPEECRRVLESLSVVYRNDDVARQRNLPPQDRLEFHHAQSGPAMDELQSWLNRQFDDRLVEPNSSLGKAIAYMLKHWQRLTLFLRVPGAPLDNNICERALKKAILHRKNALFYKTENGAHVGDLFMSLIHTCELCDANAFDYLTELDRHAKALKLAPQNWMPWNYRQTLNRITPPSKLAH